jgi:hypothetical protein
VEQFWLQEMKREFRRFGDRLQFIWTNAAVLRRDRGTLPDDAGQSAIFFAILSLDGKGEPRVDGDTLTSLHAVANARCLRCTASGAASSAARCCPPTI